MHCQQYTEADLYKQLTYFCHVLDTVRCMEKVCFRSNTLSFYRFKEVWIFMCIYLLNFLLQLEIADGT